MLRGLIPAVLATFIVHGGGALAQQPAPTPAPAPAPPPAIDLKLFDKAEVDRSRGCTVALWQPNRDPDRDRYAFLFIEQLTGANHVRQPARIKIGEQVLQLRRVATGGRTSGYGLSEYQLYKLPGDGDFAILELKLGPIEGEAVAIEDGTLALVMRGRAVFRATVKGGAGCMGAPLAAQTAPAAAPQQAAAPAAAPRPVAATAPATPTPAAPTPAAPRTAPQPGPQGPRNAMGPPPRMFKRYAVRPQQITRAFLAQVEKSQGCDTDLIRRTGIVGFQMSEESAIWQIPCRLAAYQSSSVFALVYLPDPAQNLTFSEFEGPRGRQRTSDAAALIDPEWDIATRTVTSHALGRGSGDCGVFERHRVKEDGTFVLLEYREKAHCDGKDTKPQDYPLLYRARP